MQSGREDSPLSVYSDLFPPEFFSTLGGVSDHDDTLHAWQESQKTEMKNNGKGEGKPRLIIVLKANPVVTPTSSPKISRNSMSPASTKRTVQREFDYQMKMNQRGRQRQILNEDMPMPFEVPNPLRRAEGYEVKSSHGFKLGESDFDRSAEEQLRDQGRGTEEERRGWDRG